MVMSKTSAVEASIQAVSPESILAGGVAAAGAAAASLVAVGAGAAEAAVAATVADAAGGADELSSAIAARGAMSPPANKSTASIFLKTQSPLAKKSNQMVVEQTASLRG